MIISFHNPEFHAYVDLINFMCRTSIKTSPTSLENYCSSLAHSSSKWQEIFTWPELLGDGHLAHGPAGLRGDHSTNAVKQR